MQALTSPFLLAFLTNFWLLATNSQSHNGEPSKIESTGLTAKELRLMLSASENGSLPIIKELLKKATKLALNSAGVWKLVEDKGDTPFHKAGSRDQIGALKVLLPSLKDLLLVKNKNNLTAFHEAVIHNSVQVVEYLINLEKPALLELREDTYDRTPLYLAAEYGHFSLVKFLVSHDANIYARSLESYGGALPIHEAAHYGHVDIVALLHSKGCSLEIKESWYQRTPLHEAAISGSLELVKLIVERGGDMSAQSEMRDHRSSPIHWAAALGHLDIVRFMLDEDPLLLDVTDRDGDRPYHTATLNNRTELVDYFLLEFGIDIESRQTCFSRTMLHQAASRGYVGLVRRLLELGAEPFVRSNSFDCEKLPIHLAAGNCHLDVIKLLVDAYPRMLAMRDGCGHSIIQLTTECQNQDGAKDVVAWIHQYLDHRTL